MEDSSYDCVACNFTLCSIPDVTKALFEINRVLKPRGKFVFLEHGLSDTSKVQVCQHLLNPLQKIIGDGCHLNRDMDQIVRSAAFEMKSLKRFQLHLLPKSICHCFQGVPVKE